jgi:hypothetical protein
MARKQKLDSETLQKQAAGKKRNKPLQLELPFGFVPPRKSTSTLLTDYARSLPQLRVSAKDKRNTFSVAGHGDDNDH